jgi:hypothetical protein
MDDTVQTLRLLADDAGIRSVPRLMKTAAAEGIKATRKQAEQALKKRVQAQILHPPPRSTAKVTSEGPNSRYAADLIDFSQNTARPGGHAYILVLMQVWSRRLWATPLKNKTWHETNKGMKKLISEATPHPTADNNTHDLLTDAGLEFSRVELAVPSDKWVVRQKDPVDRQGIASLDKAIQIFKVTLEDLIEGKGGDWTTHLQKAVDAYNRSYNSAVLGPPKDAENGGAREFLIDHDNAVRMSNNSKIAQKRIDEVNNTGHFREATGARRAFNQQYGPKLKAEGIEGAYVKGSDEKLHLLKRVIPVPADAEEPKGKLTQPRQYKADTLRDVAEDVHSILIDEPLSIRDLASKLDVVLQEVGDGKIKTRAFINKFPDLFVIKKDGKLETVHALVLSGTAKPKVTVSKTRVSAGKADGPEEGTYREGGSSSSRAAKAMPFWEAYQYAYGNMAPKKK